MTKRIGVLLSGRGSNFEALADSVASGRIPNAEIALVLSNREAAAGIDCALGAAGCIIMRGLNAALAAFAPMASSDTTRTAAAPAALARMSRTAVKLPPAPPRPA